MECQKKKITMVYKRITTFPKLTPTKMKQEYKCKKCF